MADTEPDIFWVRHALSQIEDADAFTILRPTSPFRTAATIRRAYDQFSKGCWSSLRAVEPVKQHPGKMWLVNYDSMAPLMGEYWPPNPPGSVAIREPWQAPWHSQPTQSLPQVYVQNSSLEMAWRWCVDVFNSISGPKVTPFFTDGHEGFTIDYPEDWERAEALAPSLLGRV